MDKKRFVAEQYDQAEKTTHVVYGNTIIHSVKLRCGEILVEYCICMDPKDFNIEKGLFLCKEKVIKRLLTIYEPVSCKHTGRFIPNMAIRGDTGKECIGIKINIGEDTLGEKIISNINRQNLINAKTVITV